jgi:hypothetical protein
LSDEIDSKRANGQQGQERVSAIVQLKLRIPLALVVVAIAGCGGRASSQASGSESAVGSGGAASGASAGGVASGSVVSGSVASGSVVSGSVASGSVASGSIVGTSGSAASGSVVSASDTVTTSGTIAGSPDDAGSDGESMVSPLAIPSAGCGPTSKWAGALGKWVSQPTGCGPGTNNQGSAACQPIPPGSTVPVKSTMGSPENRGWWVYVPATYDSTKPYKVIYSGAGCGDGNYFNAGEDGYAYNTVDSDQAILVGLDYDTYSDVPGCYDDRDPQSNDFEFFPWLQNEIENELCVDVKHEFFSGFSSGASLAQQLNCAFPDKLRGFVAATGCEPGTPPYPGAQFSPCVDKPTAAFYLKDLNDTDNTYACILPACERVLEQNGCKTATGAPYTTCNPQDLTTTTPYPVPPAFGLPQGASCVQFNGCPSEYPVVFCVLRQDEHDEAYAAPFVVPLLWDWMNNKLAN